jgi:uncharacterized membrane protein
MFCSKCGAENAEGAKFCSKCGAEIGAPAKLSEGAAKPEAESSAGSRYTEKTKGFMASLFDFSFRDFITPRVIKVLYVILLILAGIGAIAIIAIMFMMGPGFGVLALLILGPLYFFLSALGYRVMLELVAVIFSIKHELADMHETVRKRE